VTFVAAVVKPVCRQPDSLRRSGRIARNRGGSTSVGGLGPPDPVPPRADPPSPPIGSSYFSTYGCVVTETYVCPTCEHAEDRSYRVRLILLTCPNCGENGRFLNRSLVDRLDEVAPADRPDDWGEMPLDERLEYAARNGLLNVSFTGPLRPE